MANHSANKHPFSLFVHQHYPGFGFYQRLEMAGNPESPKNPGFAVEMFLVVHWQYLPCSLEVNQYANEGHPYYESAADILIAEVAIRHALQTRSEGIGTLPQLLRQDACGDSLKEIYVEWTWPNPTVESWLGPPPQE